MSCETKRRHRARRVARLQRQCDVTDEDDDFQRFHALATGRHRRLSASQSAYGGSLPSVRVDLSVDEDPFDDVTSAPKQAQNNHFRYDDDSGSLAGKLGVPLSPLIQRSYSAGHDVSKLCGDVSVGMASSPRDRRSSASKFFTCVKNKLEKRELSKSSAPSRQQSGSLDVPRHPNKCPSAPHSRSASPSRRPHQLRQTSHDLVSSTCNRNRPSHLPLGAGHLQPPATDAEEWERVRNFVTSPKGIINCGDLFRRSTSSLHTNDSFGSFEDSLSAGAVTSQETKQVPLYRVLILGGPGVGKTTLSQQFITSDCLVNAEVVEGEDRDVTFFS